jgi:hypothetical protein
MISRAAIIGLGGLGLAHFRDLLALTGKGLCQVVAGCSPDIVVARQVCLGAVTGELSAAEVPWINFGEPVCCAKSLGKVELTLPKEAIHS